MPDGQGSPTRPNPFQRKSLGVSLGALGIVFGDIGTSPLYTLRESLREVGAAPEEVLGVLSLIFWALTLVVTLKYVTFLMRADNDGQGGIFALLAILPEGKSQESGSRANVAHGRLGIVPVLVIIGAALLYGDGAITPAISVLSAVEGIGVAAPVLSKAIVPLTCTILYLLFTVQRRGSKVVGRAFGPVMFIWFTTIGAIGAYHVFDSPRVLAALSPTFGARFLASHGARGFFTLGSVVLAVTGAEALYADMGHFGARPIRLLWLCFVMPSLVLCYFGQGALVLAHPELATQPFLSMVPSGVATIAMVGISSLATVIASQALISGLFSLTHQGAQLGYFPGVKVRHTEGSMEGQVYVAEVNRLLAIACLLLVLGFRSSARLASAYGLAVTGTMVITSIVYSVVVRKAWHWTRLASGAVLVLFLGFDVPFLIANTTKFVAGGWVTALIGSIVATVMLVWTHGRTVLVQRYATRFPKVEEAIPTLASKLAARVPGCAAFMTPSSGSVPASMAHFVHRVHVLPETVVLLTVKTLRVPLVSDSDRFDVESLGSGIYRVVAHFGFMERPHVPPVMESARARGVLPVDLDEITYYVGRDHLLPVKHGAFNTFQESLFAFLSRNAATADQRFGLPVKQVMEIGVQLDL